MKEKEEDEKDEEERGGYVGGGTEGEIEPAIIHQINSPFSLQRFERWPVISYQAGRIWK